MMNDTKLQTVPNGFDDYWVLLIDLMGFSKMVQESEDELAATYQQITQAVQDDTFQKQVFTR